MARALQPCGTPAAYVRHLNHGEEPCEKCRKAKNAESKTRRSITGDEVRRRERIRFKVRAEAIRRLIKNHKAEYEALYEQVREEERQWAAVFAEFEEQK